MARVLIVWISCLALLLLGLTGTHSHLSPDLPHAPDHRHSSLAEHSHGDAEHSHPAAELFVNLDAAHFHAHQEHGDVDVDPPAKAAGKTLLVQVICAILIGFGLLLLRPPVWRLIGRIPPPFRPPKIRFRPFFLPPSHAPPHTA